jgi:uncharacterized membrane protein
MDEMNQQQFDELLNKIGRLAEQQDQLQREISNLKDSIYQLRNKPATEIKYETKEVHPKKTEQFLESPNLIASKEKPKAVNIPPFKNSNEKTPIEEFIGTNLLNKIGIIILVLGISYGVKYSIDHNLIDPITRVILGYLAGLILIGIAIRLKNNYKTFSAVILSGGMASLYFITYAAYDLYDLFPLGLAFALMVLFTAFTVYAALMYDQKVIAIIGLVGAYGVPLLLSDGSGKVVVLFSYITIVNSGILVLAFRKAWKPLYYIAFGLTCLIFAIWFFDQFAVDKHLWISLSFSTIFFITFYTTFLAYKLIEGEPFTRWDIVLLLSNSFIYFGFGYGAINDHPDGGMFLGLFTVFNAILHFIAGVIIFKRREVTKETFYLVAGMVLVFLTMAVPVQLDGNWVTLIWAGEAALLFWIGRTKNFTVFERLSYIAMLLTTGSLLDDWDAYNRYTKDQPELFVRFFINSYFLSSMLVLAAFGWILKLNFDNRFKASSEKEQRIFSWAFTSVAVFLLYLAVYKEVFNFWQQRYIDSEVMIYSGHKGYDPYPVFDFDLLKFKILWLLIYSAVFGLALSLVNKYFIKNNRLVIVCTAFNAFILFLFVVEGLVNLADLRSSFLQQTDAQFYFRDYLHIAIRYVSFVFMLPLVWINREHCKNEVFPPLIRQAELILLHIFILVVLSSEVVNWLELARVHESFKLGLSILWGGYALMLIIVGLKNNVKLLRLMAIVLFSVTILKLFIYDMADMSTIAKTIVMIILGALMLIASFLYNKVKKTSDEK